MERSGWSARALTGLLVLLAFLAAANVPHMSVLAAPRAQPASPTAAAVTDGRLAAMLGRLPDRPLGHEGAMVVYADIAAQTAALGVALPRSGNGEPDTAAWLKATQFLQLPQTTGRYWAIPEWREVYGFDLFQVEQVTEYAAPPLSITVLRGSFDPDELRAAWTRGGYQPIDLGAGEAYAVREDFEIDIADPGSRMSLAHLNVADLADDGTLIFGSTREGVQAALAAASGTGPSFAARPDIAPLVNAAPPGLVSALLIDGSALEAVPDPASALLGEESAQDFATRTAAEQSEARRLSPIPTALLGQTAGTYQNQGTIATGGTPVAAPTSPLAELVVVLTALNPQAAAEGAAVIEERLATQRTSAVLGGDLADRPWSELFPRWAVNVVQEEPAIVIELSPSTEVPPYFLQDLIFRRLPGFLAWSW